MAIAGQVKCAFAAAGIIIYRHPGSDRSARLRSINQVKSERQLLLTHVEAEQLVNAVQAVSQIPGGLAEAGVFKGASARLLQQYALPGKTPHLCDTFAGLPNPNPKYDAEFRRGQFAGRPEESCRMISAPRGPLAPAKRSTNTSPRWGFLASNSGDGRQDRALELSRITDPEP